MHPERTTVPDLLLERFARGELEGIDRERVAAALRDDPETELRLARIEHSDREILAAYDAQRVAEVVNLRHAARTKKGKKSVLRPILAAGAFCSLLLLIVFATYPDRGNRSFADETPESIRIKGETAILVHRLEGSQSRRLEENEIAAKGDRLQIGWRAADGAYAVLFSVDGQGNATLHFPERADLPEKIEPGKSLLLPRSYVLDGAPRFERFLLITADRPLDAAALIAQATALKHPDADPLSLPRDQHQHSFLIRKKEGGSRE